MNTTLAILLIAFIKIASTSHSFEVNFKSPITWSANNRIEFIGSIPRLEEFTSCHWENKEFTSTKTSPIWEYCWKSPRDGEMLISSCIAIFSAGLPITASKISEYYLSMRNVNGVTFQLTIPVHNTYHRIWNHICYTYSNKTNVIALHYNGQLVQDGREVVLPVIPGSSEITQHSFLIGQKREGLGIGYTPSHAFFGRITELNIWDSVLTQHQMEKMSDRETFPKGNVVSWKTQNIQVKGLNLSDIQSLSDHLKTKNNI